MSDWKIGGGGKERARASDWNIGPDVRVGTVSRRFGRMMRAERETRGLTQTQLAKLLADRGLSWYQSTVNKVETGQRSLSLDEALVVSALLEISISDADAEQQARERAARLDGLASALVAELRRNRRERAAVDAELYELEHPGEAVAVEGELTRRGAAAEARAWEELKSEADERLRELADEELELGGDEQRPAASKTKRKRKAN